MIGLDTIDRAGQRMKEIETAGEVRLSPGWSSSAEDCIVSFCAYVCGTPIRYVNGRKVPLRSLLRGWGIQ